MPLLSKIVMTLCCTVSVPRVHIRGLGHNGNKDEIRRLFSEFGPLKNVWLANKPPGFAYVFYKSFHDAEKAVACYDNKKVCGMTVSVDLSAIEDKYNRREYRRDSVMNDGNRSSYEEVDGGYIPSGFSFKQDYDRKGRRRSTFRSSRERERNDQRSSPFNERVRPNDFQHGRRLGKGQISSFEDDHRRDFPDRRGPRGRGHSINESKDRSREMYRDMGSYKLRGRGNGRPDYEDDNRHGGPRSRGSGSRMGRLSNDRSHSPGVYEHRQGPRERLEFRDHVRRGHESMEKPRHEHTRPDPNRFLSPPPPPKRLSKSSTRKRTLGSPVGYEIVAKRRRNEAKNSQQSEWQIMRGSDPSDIDYRHRRQQIREDQWASRVKDIRLKHSTDILDYGKHSPKKTHRHSESLLLTREDYSKYRKHRVHDRSYIPASQEINSYHKRKYDSGSKKHWKADERHDALPRGSPHKTHYPDRYKSPLRDSQAFAFPSLLHKDSLSRSRSVSSHAETSDTSRGPSVSPTPPHHKQSLLFRTPSQSRSPSPLPGISRQYENDYQPKEPSQEELASPLYSHNSPAFRSPSPVYTTQPPTLAIYNSPPPVYSPNFDRHIDHDTHLFSKEKRQVEYGDEQDIRAEHKSKREVFHRDRERKITYNVKQSSDRLIEVGGEKQGRYLNEKKAHGRRVSESFDTLARSSGHQRISPVRAPRKRNRVSPGPKRSAILGEYVT